MSTFSRKSGAYLHHDTSARLTSSLWAQQDDFWSRSVEALTPRDQRRGLMGSENKPKITLRKFSWQ